MFSPFSRQLLLLSPLVPAAPLAPLHGQTVYGANAGANAIESTATVEYFQQF
jgi:hypothetical protein